MGIPLFIRVSANFYKHFGSFCNFFISQNLANPYFTGYLPQQFSYFLPLPQVEHTPVFIVFMAFIILLLFLIVSRLGTLLFIVLVLLLLLYFFYLCLIRL